MIRKLPQHQDDSLLSEDMILESMARIKKSARVPPPPPPQRYVSNYVVSKPFLMYKKNIIYSRLFKFLIILKFLLNVYYLLFMYVGDDDDICVHHCELNCICMVLVAEKMVLLWPLDMDKDVFLDAISNIDSISYMSLFFRGYG